MAKPRLMITHFGLWACLGITPSGRRWVVAHGLTPTSAYDAWRQKCQ